MSYVEAIRFKSLTNQLNKSEKHQFILSLLEHDNEILFTALFKILINPSRQKKHEGENMNNMLSNIIRKRKNKPKTVIKYQLDYLSSPLIGSIASYLDQQSYVRLGVSNRAVCLGCHDRNQLQEMELRSDMCDYSAIDLSLYPSVTHLLIDLNKFDTFPHIAQGITVLNTLQKVTMLGNEESNDDILDFIHNNHMNLDHIQSLHLDDFDNVEENVMGRLLNTFSRLQYLEIYNCGFGIDVGAIKTKLTHLRGLSLGSNVNERIEIDMIRAFGDTLTSLSFSGGETFVSTLSVINFNTLEELNAKSATPGAINAILKTAKHLRKIKIGFSRVTCDQIKQTMAQLLTSCESLTHLEYGYSNIHYGHQVGPVLDGIEDGLFRSKTLWKRESLTIKILDWRYDEKYEITSRIAAIIHWLQMSQIKDWMFVWEGWGQKDWDENEIIKEMQELGSQITVFIDKSNSRGKTYYATRITVVCNQNCKIQGYGQTVFGS